MENNKQSNQHEETIGIGPLEKNGEKMMKSVEDGNMAAVLSGNEIMYLYVYQNKYHCFIHPIEGEEGRHKAWDINERNRAMFKNLDSAADQLFEIKFGELTDYMGIMVSAERGIVNFLKSIGQAPGEDVDFMDAINESPTGQNIPQ